MTLFQDTMESSGCVCLICGNGHYSINIGVHCMHMMCKFVILAVSERINQVFQGRRISVVGSRSIVAQSIGSREN